MKNMPVLSKAQISGMTATSIVKENKTSCMPKGAPVSP